MSSLKIELHNAKNFTREQRIKLYRALRLCVKTVNHPLFKQEVLNFRWYDKKNKKWVNNYRWNENLSNKQIYDLIMSGYDIYNKKIDYDIDMDVTLYYEDSNTIGYTYKNVMNTYHNAKFFDKFDIASLSGHFCHEALHNMGLDHEVRWNSLRKYTAVYAIGYIVRDLGKQILKGRI
jgi:hypothetical protein